MSRPVFAHGRLRLYLLKLLDEAPRHGYEVIRLLEERFHGLYAPSAGTVYPRLAKLEQEGLVEHSVEGGRKVYRITDAGRAELASRASELAELEAEIHDSVSQLADQIREDVRDSAQSLREEMRAAARESRRQVRFGDETWRADRESWQRAKEEWRVAKEQAKEQTREAKEQARSAREEAREAKEQARAVREQARREASRIGDQIRSHIKSGDWPTGLSEGLSELTRTLSGLADPSRWTPPGSPEGRTPPGRPVGEPVDEPVDFGKSGQDDEVPADLPGWATVDESGEPLRELSGLLDRFRDEVRDQARDAGVTADSLQRARSVLADAAARLRRR
ncbi:PadR family transcriptional regulator [Streptacidiphilus fuscans]|uniref:Helix-turn-helix transcriptional regulator n=1 Tax=Streptacidiphilus fuscans TaxID=2789292 RepID=A0A931AY33_9ACTN|nr:PadR family transcriptional regulator [Streptacidiphilus fuscans]MBF9067544.1 helix-turn-helix transcriptional regulator [Streptacidiphilus fuscans]